MALDAVLSEEVLRPSTRLSGISIPSANGARTPAAKASGEDPSCEKRFRSERPNTNAWRSHLREGAGAGSERVRLDSHPLGDVDEQVAQRNFARAVGSDLLELAATVTATGQHDRQVVLVCELPLPMPLPNSTAVESSKLCSPSWIPASRVKNFPNCSNWYVSSVIRCAIASSSLP